MLKKSYPYYLANEAVYANEDLIVYNKYTGDIATKVARADEKVIDEAIGWTVNARDEMRRMPAYRRSEVLQYCIERFKERFDDLADSLCIEAGKPIRDARGEVTRLIDTFKVAAEEAIRWGGQYMPLDISPRAAGYQSITKRVPIGPCSFISPFNFPLNLAAHKVAPAIATGCPFVLKPASWTPIGALIIGEVLAETDLPKGAFSILPCSREGAGLFTTDGRLKFISFTGSPEAGWGIKEKAGKKKVILELGGNAGCIVDEGTNIQEAAKRITFGAFYQSGQSCISVQRVYAHKSLYDELKSELVNLAKAMKIGDPHEESTEIGPIISEYDAKRIESWIKEAVDSGANLLCNGERNGVFIGATWLENVNPEDKISCREVFGPVAIIQPFEDFKDAINKVNDSVYGLQAGVFTPNLDHAFYAWDELEVGGVVINDIPSMRVDSMPYGGVKNSGLGREGILFAMEDMTEIRLMVLKNAGKI